MKTTHTLFGGSSLLTCSLLFSPFICAQLCSTGCIYVSGNNCGCWQNCDLSAYNGPTCNSGTLGNCDDGHQYTSVRMPIPNGCSLTANISMATRIGCPHSAADGGPSPCSSCDQIRVRSSSSTSKAYKSGSDNTDIYDSETVVGPDTLIIEGYANRQDEIVSYSISYSSGVCDGSCVVLPLVLLDFKIESLESESLLTWTTSSEINLSHYTISTSQNGYDFDPFQSILPTGQPDRINRYELLVPHTQNWQYMRLEAFDLNRQLCFTKIVSKPPQSSPTTLFLIRENGQRRIQSNQPFESLHVYSETGRQLLCQPWTMNGVLLPEHLHGNLILQAHGNTGNTSLLLHL